MKFLSKKQVRDIVGLSYAHTHRLEKDGLFPQRVKLGHHHNSRAMYVEDEITDWMHERIAERDKTHSS